MQKGMPILSRARQTIPPETSQDTEKAALNADDEDAFQKISAIIQREQQRAFWQKLNYVTGKK
jgi:hypothetical protein